MLSLEKCDASTEKDVMLPLENVIHSLDRCDALIGKSETFIGNMTCFHLEDVIKKYCVHSDQCLKHLSYNLNMLYNYIAKLD